MSLKSIGAPSRSTSSSTGTGPPITHVMRPRTRERCARTSIPEIAYSMMSTPGRSRMSSVITPLPSVGSDGEIHATSASATESPSTWMR